MRPPVHRRSCREQTRPRLVRSACRYRWAFALAALILLAPQPAGTERLPIKIFTTADGLVHNAVNRIVKSSQGFLWFCTDDGLSRFDGYVFTNFGPDEGLPAAPVNDFVETRSGAHWVATGDGLIRFNPKGAPGRRGAPTDGANVDDAMFTRVVPADPARRARIIQVVLESADGQIWVGTGKGLYRVEYVNGRETLVLVNIGLPGRFPEEAEVVDLSEDEHRTLWIATPAGLYRRWPDGTAARYTTRDGLPGEFFSDLHLDRSGTLWAATRTAGFFSLTATARRDPPVVGVNFSDGTGLTTAWTTQLFQSSEGRFWVGTDEGLVEYTPSAERKLRAYTEQSGLIYPFVSALTEDLGGNLWVGTGGAGVMKVARGGFTSFGNRDGLDAVNAIFEDRFGNLCFRGTVLGNGTASVFEGASLPLVGPDAPIVMQRYGCLSEQRFAWFKPDAMTYWGWVKEGVTIQTRTGEWWLGMEAGVMRFDATPRFAGITRAQPRSVFHAGNGLAASQIYRLFEDSRGDVWISSISSQIRGLARWEPRTGRLIDLGTSPGLPSLVDDLARSFAEDPAGQVWLGFNAGLVRYRDGVFKLFSEADGFPPGATLDMHVDRTGRLWVAHAQGGLILVSDAEAVTPAFRSYTTANGLSSNNLAVITEDSGGYLYVGGGHGLDRFDPYTGRVRHFTVADGLMPGTLKAAYRDRHGVLWFGTSNGLARLAPAMERPPAPPPILISGLRIAGLPQRVSALGEPAVSLPDIAPDRNRLEIDFVALGFGPGEVLRYQYMLEGADAEWSALSAQRTVSYAGVAPGHYRFVVRAISSDGLSSPEPASVSFTILAPVWRRWWFLSGLAVAAALAVHGAYRYRLARLLEVANMRTHIATDLHDDIGANLTRIALLSEVAARTHEQVPLLSIARIARESVESMSDIVWAINPRRENLRELTRRMRQHADELFTTRGIELHFSAPPESANPRLGIDLRRDLLLVFKEAVNNAARHSRCTAVTVELHLDGSRLVLIVSDDGVGFDTGATSDGQGLASMNRRARRLNGTLTVTSGPSGGTRLTLTAMV